MVVVCGVRGAYYVWQGNWKALLTYEQRLVKGGGPSSGIYSGISTGVKVPRQEGSSLLG